MSKKRLIFAAVFATAFLLHGTPAFVQQLGSVGTDALVLVNSTSPAYSDFRWYIQPYLDNFGVPYTELDIATAPVPANLGDYAVIIIGHRQLDVDNLYLDPTEQRLLLAAVDAGSGLINFDNDLWRDGDTSRYQFVSDVFNFSRLGSTSGSGVIVTDASGAASATINCWEDSHQEPVLVTTTNPADINLADGRWTEFFYQAARPFPTVVAGADEYENSGLPVMRFYASGIPNGSYDVYANLYTSTAGRDMRYYYGYSPAAPKTYFVDTVGGSGGPTEHSLYRLGSVTITDGNFSIYVQDADLLSGSYPVFGWAWVQLTPVGLSPSSMHYITSRHEVDESIPTGTMMLAGIGLPSTATALAVTGDQPFVAVTSHGSGRAVQWGSYDWMSHAVRGPVYGLDDLVWRSIVWAARKPFVMQSMPPLVTMRVDDETGPFDWIHIANEFGLRPWAGLFVSNVSDSDAADLSALIRAGQATASIHAFTTTDFFYYDHYSGRDLPDATVSANFAAGTQWHQSHNIPISKFMLPHYYELGTNVFAGLRNWGVEFVGTHMNPGTSYGAEWIRNGPYRRYEAGSSSSAMPMYYADFLQVLNHPEFDGEFFNCVTEIRDDAGYEWFPDNDVAGTIGRGTRQLRRALDSRALPTLFTHGYYLDSISSDNWRAILQGITSNVASYQPVYVTMDYACQYARAISTSNIASGSYDSAARTVRTILTGFADVPTMFSLFTQTGDEIAETLVSVPAFTGTADVVAPVGSPGGGDVTPPVISRVAAVGVTASTATITWTTDEPASSQVEYGTTGTYGSSTLLDTALVTGHSQGLSGLTGSTLYHYRVLSQDEAGNLATSPDFTFTTAPTGITINCWEDNHQEPVLVTTTNPADIDLADGRWTEFFYESARPFPTVVAGADEEGYGLPVMRFSASGIPNGDYEVYANLYTNDVGRDMRYYYGYSPTAPKAYFVDTVGGSGSSTQHTEYRLGTVTISNGIFNIYVQDADLLGGSYPVFGWAWIRLVSTNAAVPLLDIDDVSLPEGNSGTTNATFTVTLSEASGRSVTVDYATADGTASEGSDYTGVSGTLVFAPGVVTQTINVPVVGDVLNEGDETFTVTLSNPTTARMGAKSQGSGMILNDDLVPSLSINDVSLLEGNSGTTPATFTVTLSTPSGQVVTVKYATGDGTAVAPGDYTAGSGTVTFAPGEVTQTISVPVVGNLLNELDKAFVVTLNGPAHATLGTKTQGVGMILNDDPVPSLSINDVLLLEGNTGTTPAVFTVTLSAASGQTVTVNCATANGTATAGLDYTGVTGTLTFAPGEVTQTISVPVGGDGLHEGDETFTVTLSAPAHATLADGLGVGTIVDDDAALVPTLTIDDVVVPEGNTGTTAATFTVTLSAASGQPVTVHYATANGTAVAPGDYYAASGTLTFAPGVTVQTVSVLVLGDTQNEGDETFAVTLDAPVNAALAGASGTGTILNDDPVPSLSINDVSLPEGNTGTTAAVFTVSLSGASGQPVTVHYATGDGTAVAPGDYTAGSGTATFAPGEVTETISVPVAGDVLNEAHETFTVTLSAPEHATLGAKSQGIGTILNDDLVPSLSINDVSLPEGNTGTTAAVFTVSLSGASGQPVTVHYATGDGSAVTPGDYAAASGTLTFAPGVTVQTVSVSVLGDALNEGDETFTVTVDGPVNATLARSMGTGTILNDDPVPSLSINDVSVTEGNSGTVNATFTVTLSAVSSRTVTVAYATVNGTATAGLDYTGVTGTVTFAPGEMTQTVAVPILGDTLNEVNETFVVNLSSAVNAMIADGQGVGTILNDDEPSLSVNDVSVTEGNRGSVNARFTVTLSAASSQTVTVAYATANGTAVAGSDYQSASGTLTFAPGTTRRSITIRVYGDRAVEPDETFFVNLSHEVNATIAKAQGVGTIVNND
jgi:hypothetical protein